MFKLKKEIKIAAISSVCTALLVTGIPAVAEGIDVAFNQIKLTVNGNKVDADNILYNGRTYVQMRAISEMLGKDVGWDQETKTASINDKKIELKEYLLGESGEANNIALTVYEIK
jgi:hypothetical protein